MANEIPSEKKAVQKTSTELLQALIDKEAGKKDETFKSKLTDTDTLKRFIGGLAAIASGEAGLGAALIGSGAANAAEEAAADNKTRDEVVKDLSLKMVDLTSGQEQNIFNQVVLHPELGKFAGPIIDRMANTPDGMSLHEISQARINDEERKALANSVFEASQNIRDPKERKAAVAKAIKLRGWDDDDGQIADALSAGKIDMNLMVTLASKSTSASTKAAFDSYVKGEDPSVVVNKFVPQERVVAKSAGAYKAEDRQRAVEIRAKVTAWADENGYPINNDADFWRALREAATPEEQAEYALVADEFGKIGGSKYGVASFDPEFLDERMKIHYNTLTEANKELKVMGREEEALTEEQISQQAYRLAKRDAEQRAEELYAYGVVQTTTTVDYLSQMLAGEDGEVTDVTTRRVGDAIISVMDRLEKEHPEYAKDQNIIAREAAIALGLADPATSLIPKDEKAKDTTSPIDEPGMVVTAEDLGEGNALLPGMDKYQNKRVEKVNKKKRSEEKLLAARESREAREAERIARKEAARNYLFNQEEWVSKNISNDMSPEEVERKIKNRVKEVGIATVNPASALFFKPGSKLVDNFVDDRYEDAIEHVIPGDTIQETATLILEYLEGDLERRTPK